MRRLFPFCASFLIAAMSWAAAPATNWVGPNTILILPFAAPAGADSWIGKAVQQDLLTDLSQGTTARVMAPAELPAAADPAAARKLAQDAGAAVVVFGQVQSSAGQVRLSGQVLDAATGRPLGNLKATGASSDLFHLEDGMAGQTLAAVPRSMLTAQALQAEQQASQPAAGQQPPAVQPPATEQSGGYSVTTQGTGYNPPVGADSYAVPPASAYVYGAAPPVYSYTYYEPAPVYGYGYPVPAYTYGCPSFDLFPFGGAFLFFDFDDFHHSHRFRDHDFDGDWHNGWFHRGGEGRGGEFARGTGTGHGSARAGAAGSTRFGAGASNFARTGTPRGSQSRGGFVSAAPTGRTFGGTASISRSRFSGPGAAGSFGRSGGSPGFSGPRFYGGAGTGGFHGTSGAGFGGTSGGGFHGGFSGGGFHGGGGGFHGGGGFGAAAAHGGGGGRR